MKECVPPYDSLYNKHLHERISMSARAQDNLTWKLFMEGKLVKSWAHIQEDHFQSSDRNARNRKNWAAKIINSIQEVIHIMWANRNKCLHQNDSSEYVTKETELLNKRVTQEYEKGINGLHPNYHDVFLPSQDEVMKFNIPKKRRWLETVEVYRKRAQRENFDRDKPRFFSAQDKVNFRKRSIRMKISSNLRFYKWWMRWHPHTSDLHYKFR